MKDAFPNPPGNAPSPLVYGPGPGSMFEAWDSSEWLRIVLEKLWLIVLMGVVGFFAAYGYLAHLTPLYVATGSLAVEPPRQAPAGRDLSDDEPNLGSTEELNTLVQALQRPSFLLDVANDPALQADLSLFPSLPSGASYTDQQKIAKIVEAVRVAQPKGTLLIAVSATHPQPATAQRICEAMLVNFVKARMESRSGTEQETYQFLLSEADRLGTALADKEREIQKYDQLEKLDAQITELKARLAEMSQRYKDKYPAMVEGRALLQTLQDSFDTEMGRIINADQAAGVKPAVTIDPATGITDDLRARMIGQYQVLKREIDTQRALFESLSAQRNQTDVLRGAQADSAVKIGDNPVLPETPVSQNPGRMLFAGAFFGAALGVGLAFLFNTMDRSIRTVDQTEALLDLPVLAAVPEIAHRRKKGATTAFLPGELPVLTDGNSPPAEAIRSLRAAMALMGAEEDRRSVIFTSALPGEGKSFTAANYALSLAQQDLKTLLVDADLRRPNVHALFGGERRTIGLVDYLLAKDPLTDFVTTTSIPHLHLLLSGTPAPNPAELLSGHGFARLIAEAMRYYDRIVVDTAPVNAVSDTLMLLGEVQSVCLVVRAASSPREAVARAVRVLDKSGRRPVGILFNRVPRRADLGYPHNYYYHYGTDRYGTAYGAASS
jgi:capsular exopolysaccharide synthesis family protein